MAKITTKKAKTQLSVSLYNDLVKICNTTKCKKFLQEILPGRKKVQFDNGQLLFSLTAIQDATEVAIYGYTHFVQIISSAGPDMA